MKASPRLLAYTLGLAIATTSILVTSPASAKKEKPHHSEQTQSVTTTTVNTLIQVASSSSCGCNTFVNAIQTAGLVQTFSSTTSSYTLFIPSDAAFAALPPGTLTKLLRPENRVLLQQILSYHILYGTIDSKKIKEGKIKTYGGKPVEIKFKKGKIEIGKAKIKKADLKARNGYIHVIDTVLIPPGLLI